MTRINGRERPEVSGWTLAELLAADGLDAAPVACEADGRIVARDRYAAHVIGPDETIEIVRFVGGG